MPLEESKPSNHPLENLAFLVLDFNYVEKSAELLEAYIAYSDLSPLGKLAHLQNKIKEAYIALKEKYPAKTVCIIMRQNIIFMPPISQGYEIYTPLSEAEKETSLNALSSLTKDNDLIIIAGSMVYVKDNIVYDRSYVLAQNKIVDFQGKENFSEQEQKVIGKYALNTEDKMNKVIRLKVRDQEISLLIDLGKDRNLNKSKAQVDIYCSLTNSLPSKSNRLTAGKVNIHCDSMWPIYHQDFNLDKPSLIYISPGSFKNKTPIFRSNIAHCTALRLQYETGVINPGFHEIDYSDYYPEKLLISVYEEPKIIKPVTYFSDEEIKDTIERTLLDTLMFFPTIIGDSKISNSRSENAPNATSTAEIKLTDQLSKKTRRKKGIDISDDQMAASTFGQYSNTAKHFRQQKNLRFTKQKKPAIEEQKDNQQPSVRELYYDLLRANLIILNSFRNKEKKSSTVSTLAPEHPIKKEISATSSLPKLTIFADKTKKENTVLSKKARRKHGVDVSAQQMAESDFGQHSATARKFKT